MFVLSDHVAYRLPSPSTAMAGKICARLVPAEAVKTLWSVKVKAERLSFTSVETPT